MAFMPPPWPNAFDMWAGTLWAVENPKEEAGKGKHKKTPKPCEAISGVCVRALKVTHALQSYSVRLMPVYSAASNRSGEV